MMPVHNKRTTSTDNGNTVHSAQSARICMRTMGLSETCASFRSETNKFVYAIFFFLHSAAGVRMALLAARRTPFSFIYENEIMLRRSSGRKRNKE